METFDPGSFDFLSVRVEDILPQREPFVMIDSLISFSYERTVTRLTVRRDNIFFTGGRLSHSGLLENVAQTCAARTGFINKYILRVPVSVGLVCAIKDTEIFRLPSEGELLETTVDVRGELEGMLMVAACVRSGEGKLMEGIMSLSTKGL